MSIPTVAENIQDLSEEVVRLREVIDAIGQMAQRAFKDDTHSYWIGRIDRLCKKALKP